MVKKSRSWKYIPGK